MKSLFCTCRIMKSGILKKCEWVSNYIHIFLKKNKKKSNWVSLKWFGIATKINIPKAVWCKIFSTNTVCSFEIADLDRGPHSEAWVEGLQECGLEPVQEGHAAAYVVESQHTGAVVQVHAYPGGVGGADGFVHPVVPGGVARVRAQQTPGFVIVAQQARGAFALPADTAVGHSDGELPVPLDFPVEASSGERLPAQHLGKAVEALRVVSVGLQVSGADDLSAALRDAQLLVGRVGIQLQLAEVCRRTESFRHLPWQYRRVTAMHARTLGNLHFRNSDLVFGSAEIWSVVTSLAAPEGRVQLVWI